ncbi:MAG: hypothetical protein MUO34_15140 [Ignavibacteriaceae bacterium]|nr:hypothetical protein [Ignavibacteriaceae bacterium]
MSIVNKLNSFKADWLDVALIKIGVFTATLLFAKLWSPILSVEWYWYLIIWIVVAIRPFNTFYKWLMSATK